MTVAYGYRIGEVRLKPLAPLNHTATISMPKGNVDQDRRPPVAITLGTHVDGCAPPKPDLSHTKTAMRGTIRRFATRPQRMNRRQRNRLRKFIKRWLKKNLVPLDPDTDFSVESWLKTTNYPAARQMELLAVHQAMICAYDPEYWVVKSFIKEETYPEYKDARPINSRSDEFKTIAGPYFKRIEEQLFKLDWFIKKIPVPERAKYIKDKLYHPSAKYLASDYTSFEAHFTREVMETIELQLYQYMMSKCPNHLFTHVVLAALTGMNHVKFKDFTVNIEAIRMSGEMCTSLGNGFSNLMLMLFALHDNGCTHVAGVVEGDDALFAYRGRPPDGEYFRDLGFNIKLEYHDELNTASFCGLVFDIEDLVNVTDVRQVLLNFGWTTRAYVLSNRGTRMMLLRAKGFSLAYEYRGCPILGALARYALRVTRTFSKQKLHRYVTESKNINEYERGTLLEAIKIYPIVANMPVPTNTRYLVERLYGVTVETQIAIEKYLDSLTKLQPLRLPAIYDIMPEVSKHYFHHYVRHARVGDLCFRTDLSEVGISPKYSVDEMIIGESKLAGQPRRSYHEFAPQGV